MLTFNAAAVAAAAASFFIVLPSTVTRCLPLGGSLLLAVVIMKAGAWFLSPFTPIRRTRCGSSASFLSRNPHTCRLVMLKSPHTPRRRPVS